MSRWLYKILRKRYHMTDENERQSFKNAIDELTQDNVNLIKRVKDLKAENSDMWMKNNSLELKLKSLRDLYSKVCGPIE